MEVNQDRNNFSKSSLNAYCVSIGIQLASGMAVFSFVGYMIDQKQGKGHEFTLIGMFLGLFYGGYVTWKLIRQLNADTEEKNKSNPNKERGKSL